MLDPGAGWFDKAYYPSPDIFPARESFCHGAGWDGSIPVEYYG
jgi:hypothetical protein